MTLLAPVFDVRLDPPAVSVARAELKLNSGPIRIDQAGIDWGDAALQAYMADMSVGSSTVDFRIPNRTVHIPLFVGADEANDFDYAKGILMQKVGRLQQEGGWLQRQIGLYADVVNATLTFPDVWGEAAGVEPNVLLQLECLPDFYGDEIALDALTLATSADAFTGLTTMPTNTIFGPLQLSGIPARIRGDWPARCRLQVSNAGTGTNVAQSLLWGLRARYSDSGGTARLGYMATDLTGVAGTTAGSGVMTNTNLQQGSWMAVLGTNIAALSGAPMTHRGSYRVWARVQSPTQPQIRFLWGVGSLAAPQYNDAVALGPSVGQRQLVDLGEIRLDSPPVGPMQWYGAIQAFPDPAGTTISIDQLLFQPLDDGGGRLIYNENIPPSLIAVGPNVPTLFSSTRPTGQAGSVLWGMNPTTGVFNVTLTANQSTQMAATDSYGFAIPSVATIVGVTVSVFRQSIPTSSVLVWDASVGGNGYKGMLLSNAGVPLGNDHGSSAAYGPGATITYGSSSDGWGAGLTPAIVNSSQFGVWHQCYAGPSGVGSAAVTLSNYTMTVYYSLATGIPVPGDAVIYAATGTPNAVNCELRTEGMYRNDPAGAVYGEVSRVIGDLPRLPVSGMENRPVEVFARLSSSDLTPALVDVVGPVLGQVQPFYRPSYLFPP